MAVGGFGSSICWKSSLCTWNGECLQRNLKPGWTCFWLLTHTTPPPPPIRGEVSCLSQLQECHFWEWWQMRPGPYTSKAFFTLQMLTSWEFKMSHGAPDELFFLVGFDQQPVTNQLCRQLMIKTSSVLLLPRCPSGNASPHDHQYYHDGGGVGCSLHGNEVHHLWGRWQNTQVSHRHDWRHCHPDRRSVSLVFDCCSQWTVYLIVFFPPTALCAIVACSWYAHDIIRAFYDPFTPVNTK